MAPHLLPLSPPQPYPSYFLLFLLLLFTPSALAATWCVARSDATREVLQAGLDYACSIAGAADCAPIQSNGLCFLPNTIQAHASYAYNSFYHRRSMAPGSCDFSGSATIATTDPSYGSCVYPYSLSTAGGAATTATTSGNTASENPPPLMPTFKTPPYSYGGMPGTATPLTSTTTDESDASSNLSVFGYFFLRLFLLCLGLLFNS